MDRMLGCRIFASLLAVAALGLAGCADRSDATPRASSAPSPAPASAPATAPPPRAARSTDPRFVAAAQAWDLGHLDECERTLLELGDAAGLDGELLRARLASSRGDDVAAVRALEGLRANYPNDERVPATAAELHAAAGRMQTAEDEIRRGLAIRADSADVERARGVLLISKSGGAAAGLEHLLTARKLDLDLPYCKRPIAAAHVLLANQAMASHSPERALAEASAALHEVPDDLDAERTLADAHAALKHFTEALALYEKLRAAGRDVGADLAALYKTAAFAALLEKDRAKAIERYTRARELGLSNDDLGFGTTVLHDAANASIDRGIASYERQDLVEAEKAFREALHYEDGSLEARNHLGIVLYGRGDYVGAAECWRIVYDTARAKSIRLPDPVHLNLARALYRLERFDEIQKLLSDELARSPDDPHAADCKALLQRVADRATASDGR